VVPKFVPVIVTEVPTTPEVTDSEVIEGAGTTVKLIPLLDTPPHAVTTTFPVVAPDGTGTAMLEALQLVAVAVIPLNFTVPVPCVEPKFAPAMMTSAPTAPVVGERLEMLGAGTTVKVTVLLATLLTDTLKLPVVAPLGTGTTMLVALQLVGVAVVPLN
jgi:hypothetical protein